MLHAEREAGKEFVCREWTSLLRIAAVLDDKMASRKGVKGLEKGAWKRWIEKRMEPQGTEVPVCHGSLARIHLSTVPNFRLDSFLTTASIKSATCQGNVHKIQMNCTQR